MARKYAFQCKNCGALEESSAAGENAVPSACHICGHGVGDPANWIILADLSDAELKKGFARHGLTKASVAKHTATVSHPPSHGKAVKIAVVEKMGSKDVGG
jgi:hypothetical protein